ncbi:MAG: ATP-binding protein [Prolixibacteraceae bacterium]|nr:ATP-binding protein [Prolixibacteraceae bacterium]
MEKLYEISNRLITNTHVTFRRSLFEKINWNLKLIEIKGSRGVGKTTLMLQKAKDLLLAGSNVLYVSADMPYFFKESLVETAETFYKYGGECLFIDEVHKYPRKNQNADWSLELKNISDSIPDLKVVYSGSSILQLYTGLGDLSRRKVSYLLKGLSFREYLEMKGIFNGSIFELQDILKRHIEISREITTNIKILPHFKAYLKTGYYPFFIDGEDVFFSRLAEIVNVIIDADIPYISDIKHETLHKMKQLLAAISTTVPYVPNLSNLKSNLFVTDQRTLIKYINLLEKAELINTLGAKAVGNKILGKPQKIYINNTNLMWVISNEGVNQGTVRETFFLNQLKHICKIDYPRLGDFIVNDKYVFEIGGKSKTSKQLKGFEHPYVVSDEIETGFANHIPLWLFGFLY